LLRALQLQQQQLLAHHQELLKHSATASTAATSPSEGPS
jgi:hypothetical protein